jgi:hypothetical protein
MQTMGGALIVCASFVEFYAESIEAFLLKKSKKRKTKPPQHQTNS